MKRVLSEKIGYLDEQTTTIQQQISKIAEEQEIRKQRDAFVNQVELHREDYIRGFDKINEGIRAWDCLIELCETGYVTSENIKEYGIEL